MSSALGVYIEHNLIKYAKVSKNNDIIKIESFGMKFYDNVEETLKQIIEETYSYKMPISINLAEEQYNYFDVFGLLNKKDIEGIIKDMKYRGVPKDFIANDIFMNSNYYLSNYTNMKPDGKVQNEDLKDLADKISKHFGV